MPDLKPTPARLALLKAVAAGEVTAHRSPNSLARDWVTWSQIAWAALPDAWKQGTGRYIKVTGRMKQMESAGWVELGPRNGPSFFAPRYWLLTDAGKAVSDASE